MAKKMTIPEALDYLDNRSDIVKFLKRKGYKNELNFGESRMHSCPVARWLQDVTGLDVFVGVVEVYLFDEEEEVTEAHRFSSSIQNAVEYFDSHAERNHA